MGLGSYIGDNAVQVDAGEREATIRSELPDLLLPDEHIVFAFQDRGGSGRDSSNLTTKRILIEDKKGFTGKKVQYISVPYNSIRAYAVETAGSWDSDHELYVYAGGVGKLKFDFVTDVDIMAIDRFLSSVVLSGKREGGDVEGGATAFASVDEGGGNIFDTFGSDFAQLDEETVQAKLTAARLLVPDETVELAFVCGRDSFVLTSKRILKIDVQGISGKRIEYKTILWSTVRGFSVETAGNFLDRDSELTIWLNISDGSSRSEGRPSNSHTRLSLDFRNGKADLFAVQRYFADKVLGTDPAPPTMQATKEQDSGSGSILAWLGDDNRMVDAMEADSQFRFLLQSNESVEMAFKGRRDMLLFTGKRMIQVDVQGFMGMMKKTEYLSFPWTTVTAFSVRTAGSMLDKDSEMCLWMDFDDVFNPRRDNEEDNQPPPIPRRSHIEIDFQKDKVDLMVIHRYLSERVNCHSGHALRPFDMPIAPELLVPKPPGALDGLMNWIGNDASAVDAGEVDAQFHYAGVLFGDEHVIFAFKNGRDSSYMTNKRILSFDTQGFTGKRKEYLSIPFDSVRSWAVNSAGSFDRDMEMKVFFKGYWNNSLKQDLRTGKADLNAINNLIAHFVIGSADGDSAVEVATKEVDSSSFKNFMTFITDDAVMEDPVKMTETLQTSPAILQADESVDAAYKSGRDSLIFTTKRCIVIDVKGISGKRVEYTSYPHMYNKAFRIRTAGRLTSGPEVEIYTYNEPIEQEFSKKSNSAWDIHRMMSVKMLEENHPEINEIIAAM